jgi:hypothetical protein
MTKLDREKALADHLLNRLGLNSAAIYDPNATCPETGIDVRVELSDGQKIGIQVTEIDPHPVPGSSRAKEKDIAKTAPGKPYGMFAQNDAGVVT